MPTSEPTSEPWTCIGRYLHTIRLGTVGVASGRDSLARRGNASAIQASRRSDELRWFEFCWPLRDRATGATSDDVTAHAQSHQSRLLGGGKAPSLQLRVKKGRLQSDLAPSLRSELPQSVQQGNSVAINALRW